MMLYPLMQKTPRKPRGRIGNAGGDGAYQKGSSQGKGRRPSHGLRGPLPRSGSRERVRTFPRRVDAERFAATIDTDIARGQYIDPVLGRMSFADFSREWLTTTGHLIREGYESILRTHLLPALAIGQSRGSGRLKLVSSSQTSPRVGCPTPGCDRRRT
jgi:hypothetical protein